MKKILLACLMMAATSAFAAAPAGNEPAGKTRAEVQQQLVGAKKTYGWLPPDYGWKGQRTSAELEKEVASITKRYGWFPPDFGWKGQKTEQQVEAELISHKVNRAEVARIEAVYFGD